MKRESRLLASLFILWAIIACDDSTITQVPEVDMALEEDMRKPIKRFDMEVDAEVDQNMADMDQSDQQVDMDTVDMKLVETQDFCEPCSDRKPCAQGVECFEFNQDTKLCIQRCEINPEDQSHNCPEGNNCEQLGIDLFACVPQGIACIDSCIDNDGDGYGIGSGCLGLDCHDDDTASYVGAMDSSCDGEDQDCDGNIDENYVPTTCNIGTCLAQSACVDGIEQPCVNPMVQADNNCNGLDDDCDGNTDESYEAESCGEGVCVAQSSCVAGSENACMPIDPPVAVDSSCNGVDDDCDGLLDDEFSMSCGLGICVNQGICTDNGPRCAPLPIAQENDVTCDARDEDCDGNVDENYSTSSTCGIGACQRDGACVNGNYVCEPGMPLANTDETCDGIDDDCDNIIDDECQRNFLQFRINDTLSTADVLAVDLYYEQLHSPTNDGTQWQPINMELAIQYPAGMTPRGPLNDRDGGFVIKGLALTEAQKTIAQVAVFRDEMGMVIPNSVFIAVLTSSGPGANTRIAPLTPDAPNRIILTMLFDKNMVQPPYSFQWEPTQQRTNFEPVEAQGALRLENGSF